jgi:hypothetical protein
MIRLGYSYLWFHIRRLYYSHGAAFISALALTGCALLACAGWALEATQLARAQAELDKLTAQQTHTPLRRSSTLPLLPALNTVSLVVAIREAATATKINPRDITYTLENQSGQPYIRYQARLSVDAAYPSIRQFVQNIVDNESYTSLDAITCERIELKGSGPVCDITISAFYKRDSDG